MSKIPALLALTATSILLAGCGGSDPNTVKVGMNIEMTGDIPAVGASSKNAAELYFNQLNEKGGVTLADGPKKVSLIVRDNAAKAAHIE